MVKCARACTHIPHLNDCIHILHTLCVWVIYMQAARICSHLFRMRALARFNAPSLLAARPPSYARALCRPVRRHRSRRLGFHKLIFVLFLCGC